MRVFQFGILLIFALSIYVKSETFILKPTDFASFYFSDKERSFSLQRDTDHRSRVYKVELITKSKANYLEKSDDGNEFTLISDNSSSVHDSTTILNGVIIRTVSVSFYDKDGGSPDSFHIEISDNYSKFTKSDGSIFGNHIECGHVINDTAKHIIDQELIEKLSKLQLAAYIYGARLSSISKGDLVLINESHVKSAEWNTCASNCVIISRKFLESSAVGKEEINILKRCEPRFYALSSELELNVEKSMDDGIKDFFRKYAVVSSWMAVEYSALIQSIISGNKSAYLESSEKLRSLAQLKLSTLKPIKDRIESINRSASKSIAQDFLIDWGF